MQLFSASVLSLGDCFDTHYSEVLALLSSIQTSTRQMQTLCAHGKVAKDPTLAKEGPGIKRVLEALIYKVKVMAKANHVLGNVWVGALKHRRVDGTCIQDDELMLRRGSSSKLSSSSSNVINHTQDFGSGSSDDDSSDDEEDEKERYERMKSKLQAKQNLEEDEEDEEEEEEEDRYGNRHHLEDHQAMEVGDEEEEEEEERIPSPSLDSENEEDGHQRVKFSGRDTIHEEEEEEITSPSEGED